MKKELERHLAASGRSKGSRCSMPRSSCLAVSPTEAAIAGNPSSFHLFASTAHAAASWGYSDSKTIPPNEKMSAFVSGSPGRRCPHQRARLWQVHGQAVWREAPEEPHEAVADRGHLEPVQQTPRVPSTGHQGFPWHLKRQNATHGRSFGPCAQVKVTEHSPVLTFTLAHENVGRFDVTVGDSMVMHMFEPSQGIMEYHVDPPGAFPFPVPDWRFQPLVQASAWVVRVLHVSEQAVAV
mmetsp:Transcript_37746/g.94610  ORF Transcript_37746/g.94610 Transcript_37746/m.94610 type:complete len:238 (+) Transcript_37746:1451-2164(+)